MNKKCNKNYQSQYAFIDNNCVHITEYVKNKQDCIKCKNGHQLICASDRPHFRHKNTEDCDKSPMTEWHCEWQGNFPNTEFEYKKKENQIKVRRADVSLENSEYNLEFQHSDIELIEVKNRKADYELHGRKIIWIVDGNNTITVKYLEFAKRYYLEFVSSRWKYESFIDYEYIYIDIDGLLYKIYPNQVKNSMIDASVPIDKSSFIHCINENNPLLHSIDVPLQCTLYIKQQGAGNGKTFGLIQNIESKDFEHYKCFIIVTKQHSAKTVIKNELQNQIENNQLKYVTDLTFVSVKNKYQISYKNTNTGNTCHILIATIDSIMYSLGNTNNKELNKFEGIVTSIIDGYIEEQNTKAIKVNDKSYKLNKEMCLIVDETQDLSEDYAKAIITIMRNKYIDSYIVGDRLQSINIENNAFQYFSNHEFSYIHKKQYEQTNICRRFYHNDLVKFVNEIIPFSKYSLPEIEQYRTDDEHNVTHLELFEGVNVYADENKINKEVEKILKFYDKEVTENNYKPNDFLIVTPFSRKNPLVNALEIAIQTYWINKYDNNVYERYAVFHKSEEGTSINLEDSENATRMVSIHTSKGDGRNVVFVIGMSENGLTRFSNESNNLVYDSLIHVSLTRMKKKLYLQFVNNGDDISNKILKFICDNNIVFEKQIINISNCVKYRDIIDDSFKKTHFQVLLDEIINKTTFDSPDEKIIIDMSHHNIRYASMLIHLYIKILKNENTNADTSVKKQIKAVFIKIIKSEILVSYNWQDYFTNLKQNELCVLKITDKGTDYVNYYNIILSLMKDIQKKLKHRLFHIKNLCPLESIVLYYMIQITDQGVFSCISVNELYNIIDVYSKSFNCSYRGHKNCSCKTHFETPSLETNENIEKMRKYLLKHYNDIYNVGKVYDAFLEEYPTVNWLIDHYISYEGTNDDFTLYKTFELIGYDANTVYIIYVKPQFNELNLYDTLIDSIYDSFLLNNCSKFKNKKIISVVFSSAPKNYKMYEWDFANSLIVEQLRTQIITNYITESKYVFNYYKWYRNQHMDVPAKRFIKNFIIYYKNDKSKYDKRPGFLLRFFEKIEDDSKILELYDDKEYFLNKLHGIITNAIDEYFDYEVEPKVY